MSPTQFINHNSKQILLMDFSTIRTTDELTRAVEEIKHIVALHKPGSLLALADFTGLPVGNDKMKTIKEMATHNRPFIKFIALVGLGCPRSLVFRLIIRLTSRKNHKVFAKRDAALEWLAERGDE
jgi:hypothetical protein